MKLKLIVAFLFITVFSYAQNKGIIAGTLTDKDLNNDSLPFANVSIKGANIGVTTDETGKYTISVDAGSYTIQFSFLGYETIEEKVDVKTGETVIINKALGSGSYQLKDVVIQNNISKEKETALLLEQKNAVEMKQAIGAQELSRKGVGDAAGAVSKTAGVSQQDGVKNVFVRGLGDRYNSTSLNGLPLPSEDPEYKNIALQFFTTDIIKNINVNKTFNSTLYGDVSGANIDIASKELEKSSVLSISVGNGFNSNAIKTSKFLVSEGTNYFGFLENGTGYPITDLNVHNFDTGFKPETRSNNINTNFSVNAGKKYKIGENSLSVFGVVQSSSEYLYSEGQTRAVNASGQRTSIDADFKKYEYNASQSGLVNVKYKFGSGKSITYNGLYIHDNKESVGDYLGFKVGINDSPDANNSFLRRQQTNNNILFSNQLLFDYKASDKWDTNVSVSYNTIDASEPDRKTNSYDYREDLNSYVVATNSSNLNQRFFSTLNEKDLAGKIDLTYTFDPNDELQKKLVFGGNYRKTDRDFENQNFNYNFFTPINIVDINNPDAVFNQENIDNGNYNLITQNGSGSNAFNPFFYTGKRDIISGYAQFIYPVNNKFIVQVGIRNENVKQKVEFGTSLSESSNPTVGPSIINKNYVLPNLLAKYSLSEKNAIRFAASQTYTYPQFKETAPFLYEGVNFNSFGNPKLVPSTNYNLDLKYDFYLSKSEIYSIGTFYKFIQDPINRIRVSSAGNDLSYVNLGNAFATGFEIEARKSIYQFDEGTKKRNFDFGLNLSYLYSNVKVEDNSNDDIAIIKTNDNSKLEGASPLLINSDLSYSFSNEKNSLTTSLVFNYFYDKVYSIGVSQNENIVEKAVPTLDFVNKFEFVKNKIGMNISFKNILNPSLKLTQEIKNNPDTNEEIIGSYKKGFFASIGFYWNL